MPAQSTATITPRLNLDFRFDASVPRHWFGGDAFKTRLFDAMSLTFPEGERFFIACVRDFSAAITDDKLAHEVRQFTQQEAQHRRAHMVFNARLADQGIKVDKIEALQKHFLFEVCRRQFSAKHTLALTVASEHLTAIMAHSMFARPALFEQANPRVRAMLAWHAVEEVEHKGVAFDVMTRVAQVGYIGRTTALLQVTLSYTLQLAQIMNHMFKVDGYTRRQRWGLWARGLWWLWGTPGLLRPLIGPYLAWFKPKFHPWQTPMMPTARVWLDQLDQSGDPVAASDALLSA